MHVTHILEATAGGSRKHVRLLAEGLRENGVAVDLILSRRGADADFEEDLQAFKDLGCSLFLVDMVKRPHPSDWAAYQTIQHLLRTRAPNIVHTHCAKAGLLGRLAARGLPELHRVHTPHSWFFEGLHTPWRQLGIALERRLARHTDLLLLISEAERQWVECLNLMPPEQVIVAPNGLPPSFFTQMAARDSLRQELKLAPDVCAIGVFARLVPKKGHAWMLDAIAAIPATMRAKLRFLCFGEGPLAATLQQRITSMGLEGCVQLLGYMPRAERLLPAMDLGILPSFYEGLPYTLLETVGAGVPLIASDVPGNKPNTRGNPILYVQPHASTQLSELIVALAQAPQERQRLGARGREWVRQHFTLERQVAMVLGAYHRLHGARRP